MEHYLYILIIKKSEGKIEKKQSFKSNSNFEEKTLRSVSAKDIINIRSDFNSINLNNYIVSIQNTNYDVENLTNEFYTYLATVLIELDLIED